MLCPLQFNGKPISWKFVKQLHTKIIEHKGLTCLPKLKYEHVHLTPFSKMRVDLAAQVSVIHMIYVYLYIYTMYA